MNFVITESQDERNLPMCKEIAEDISQAYPGYSWHVRIDGGLLIIKNQSISPIWSMTVTYSQIAHNAGHRKREVIKRAGEFLECAYLRRGCALIGDKAQALDGRKDRKAFNPLQAVPVSE